MVKKPENFCKIAVNGGECAIGRIVRSTAGRDGGRVFLIVGIEDENHLLLADGKLRTIEKPKKKKLRHVKVLPGGSQKLREELLDGKAVLNAELRRIIAQYAEGSSDEAADHAPTDAEKAPDIIAGKR